MMSFDVLLDREGCALEGRLLAMMPASVWYMVQMHAVVQCSD